MSRTLGVLISGRGSNLQAILDAIADGRLDARVGVVISNKVDAPGLERAENAGVPTVVLSHKDYDSREAFDEAVLAQLEEREVDVVCLAGFMRILHLVDEELDHGPILLQATVRVEEGDTEDSLSARILEQEHQLYPRAIQLVLDGRVRVDGRRARIES